MLPKEGFFDDKSFCQILNFLQQVRFKVSIIEFILQYILSEPTKKLIKLLTNICKYCKTYIH